MMSGDIHLSSSGCSSAGVCLAEATGSLDVDKGPMCVLCALCSEPSAKDLSVE